MAINKKIVWLPYDFDTAIGINNEGALVFSYNLEDIDTVEGGANVFNGQDSVIWKNMRAAFYNDIATMYQNLRSQGTLSYEVVEQMFEQHQNKWPEAIFNEDAYFKYILPLLDEGVGAYLEMLQGSKAEQRKWWLYNRFRYIDSKYNAGDALTDTITIRPYAADDITITPYADIYATVKWDDTMTQERAPRNQSVTLECPYSSMNDNVVIIYSASQLASIGDISGLKPGLTDIANAVKLQSLKLGDASSSYSNQNLRSLTLGNNVLLQSLDVRNCGSLATAIDASGCTNIEEVYFDGTSITGITLPNGGVLRILHLPATITNLTLRNQTNITDLTVAGYSNISTLRIENSSVNSLALLRAVPATTRVRIIGFTWEAEDADDIEDILDTLDTMRGLDESGNNVETAQVSGTIHTGSLSGDQIASYQARYPYINFTADVLTTYLYYYNGSTLWYTETIANGGDGTYSGTPSKASTAQYNYNFAGWSKTDDNTVDTDARTAVTTNRNIYACYTAVTRTYTVTWKNADGTTLETDNNVPYGTTPTYDGQTPTYQGETSSGWNPTPGPITGNTTYTAVYVPTYQVRFYNGGTLLETVTVTEGEDAVYSGETPTSPDGEFIGWIPNPVNVMSNMDVYADFLIDIVEPDLKYLVYTTDDVNMTMTITGLNTAQIVADGLNVITIPDTIQGYHVIIG